MVQGTAVRNENMSEKRLTLEERVERLEKILIAQHGLAPFEGFEEWVGTYPFLHYPPEEES